MCWLIFHRWIFTKCFHPKFFKHMIERKLCSMLFYLCFLVTLFEEFCHTLNRTEIGARAAFVMSFLEQAVLCTGLLSWPLLTCLQPQLVKHFLSLYPHFEKKLVWVRTWFWTQTVKWLTVNVVLSFLILEFLSLCEYLRRNILSSVTNLDDWNSFERGANQCQLIQVEIYNTLAYSFMLLLWKGR